MLIGINRQYILVGEMCVTAEAHILQTTLGSCVAVTAWHQRLKLGAMTHYLLPQKGEHSSNFAPGYYGVSALFLLLKALREYGDLQDFRFDAFGGGCFYKNDHGDLNVGVRNIKYARYWAAASGIQFDCEDFGENKCRVVQLDCATGDIKLKSFCQS